MDEGITGSQCLEAVNEILRVMWWKDKKLCRKGKEFQNRNVEILKLADSGFAFILMLVIS